MHILHYRNVAVLLLSCCFHQITPAIYISGKGKENQVQLQQPSCDTVMSGVRERREIKSHEQQLLPSFNV